MSPARRRVRALILTPTRELADQVYDNVRQYASLTPLRSTVVFGGMDMDGQTQALRSGCAVLAATPGRSLDHVQQKNTSLGRVEGVDLDDTVRRLLIGLLPHLARRPNLLPPACQHARCTGARRWRIGGRQRRALRTGRGGCWWAATWRAADEILRSDPGSSAGA